VRALLLFAWLCVAVAGPVGAISAADDPSIADIQLPPGFQITVYARVPGARSMTLSPSGTLFIGTREEGKVYAVLDRNRDGTAEQVLTIARGLDMPNGVALRNGSLYVAETSRILRYDNIEKRLTDPPPPLVVSSSLPRQRAHGWKFLRFGPDGWLYFNIGAPCNVCEPKGPLFATITRMKPDGTSLEVYARGVRNSVGFDWDPDTHELWFTDNGRDWLGDDLPPDELNHAPRKGLHFGFPYCFGKNAPDPQFGKGKDLSRLTPAAMDLGPHVASLGMRFYTGSMFPEKYHEQIFIAEHGSWNRTVPIGYRVTLVRLENKRPISYEVFAQGWLRDGQVSGRPVDVEILPDGSLAVSDDYAGLIYRIGYRKP